MAFGTVVNPFLAGEASKGTLLVGNKGVDSKTPSLKQWDSIRTDGRVPRKPPSPLHWMSCGLLRENRSGLGNPPYGEKRFHINELLRSRVILDMGS